MLYEEVDSDIRSWRAVEARLVSVFAEKLEAFDSSVQVDVWHQICFVKASLSSVRTIISDAVT